MINIIRDSATAVPKELREFGTYCQPSVLVPPLTLAMDYSTLWCQIERKVHKVQSRPLKLAATVEAL